MRVRSREVGGGAISTKRTRSGASKTGVQEIQGIFQATLRSAEEEMVRGDLGFLLGEVDRCSAELRRWRGRTQLEAYKRAVKAFVQKALEEMYVVISRTRFNAQGRRTRSVIVQQIDRHLAELTEEILHGSRSTIPLAARLDEIRGLLCDLYG